MSNSWLARTAVAQCVDLLKYSIFKARNSASSKLWEQSALLSLKTGIRLYNPRNWNSPLIQFGEVALIGVNGGGPGMSLKIGNSPARDAPIPYCVRLFSNRCRKHLTVYVGQLDCPKRLSR